MGKIVLTNSDLRQEGSNAVERMACKLPFQLENVDYPVLIRLEDLNIVPDPSNIQDGLSFNLTKDAKPIYAPMLNNNSPTYFGGFNKDELPNNSCQTTWELIDNDSPAKWVSLSKMYGGDSIHHFSLQSTNPEGDSKYDLIVVGGNHELNYDIII